MSTAGQRARVRPMVYCARGQAENLIKAHKLHLASDRTSCRKATANQFRLLIHTAAYWLMLSLRGLAPRNSFWREAQFDTIRLRLIKVAGRVTEMVTRIKLALPSALSAAEPLHRLGRPRPAAKEFRTPAASATVRSPFSPSPIMAKRKGSRSGRKGAKRGRRAMAAAIP